MPPNARAGSYGRGHRFAAYPRCSTDKRTLMPEWLLLSTATGIAPTAWPNKVECEPEPTAERNGRFHSPAKRLRAGAAVWACEPTDADRTQADLNDS